MLGRQIRKLGIGFEQLLVDTQLTKTFNSIPEIKVDVGSTNSKIRD